MWSSTARAAALLLGTVTAVAPSPFTRQHQHLGVDIANPSYFRFRGKTVALISSGEHYGGLLNLKFNYTRYFDALAADGFTLTQAFSGSYVEPDSDCNPNGTNPEGNTLSPDNGSFIAPWHRTAIPGGTKGGSKFDLTKYDPRYFRRLVAFVEAASTRGVVVELGLFCGYDATHEFIWEWSPQNAANNINGLTHVNRTNVYTLAAGNAMLQIQLEMVRRIVAALQPYDNVVMEVVFTTDGLSAAWAEKIIGAVRQADPERLVVVPVQWIDHIPAAWRSTIVANCGAGSNCSIGVEDDSFAPPTPSQTEGHRPSILDSSGQATSGVDAYRHTYWKWFMRGGGAVYNLDWSYTVGHETGTKHDPQATPPRTPSGPVYRKVVSVLCAVLREFDLRALVPSTEWIHTSNSSERAQGQLFGLAPNVTNSAGGESRARTTQFLAYMIGRSVLQVDVSVCGVEAGAPQIIPIISTCMAVEIEGSCAYCVPGASCNAHWIDPSTNGSAFARKFVVQPGIAVDIPTANGVPGRGLDTALKLECT